MTNQPCFDVFLAHNSEDKPQVRTIATKLKQRDLKVWLDEDQILPGRSIQDAIQQAIQNVKSAAVFIGSGGLGNWQKLELESLLRQFVDAKIPVIPVLLPGVKGIPENLPFLQSIRWVHFANGIDDEKALDELVKGITQESSNSIVLPQTSRHFDLLLFYNDEDNQEVQPIINRLREYQIQLWLTQEVRGGNSWQQVLETQLAQIKSVAVFIGRSGSLWRREQIEPFIWEFIEQDRPVIPVILANVLQEPELPIYLRPRIRVDFRQQVPNPMEQLIRGITEKPPTPLPTTDPISPTTGSIWNKSRLLMVLLIGMTIGITGTLIALKFIIPTPIALRFISPPPTNWRISLGEKILVSANTNPEKQEGVQAFASGEFDTAIAKFKSSLSNNKNDPEALIYWNNAKAANKNTYRIAVSVPIGGNVNVAQEILRGVAQAQDEVNDGGGINQMPLQVEIANDDNDPNIAKQIATEFVQDNGIWAVVGHNTSDVSISAAQVYQGRLVMISPTSLSDSLSQIGINGYIFRTVPSVRFITDTLAEYAVKKAGKPNIGICVDNIAIDNTEFANQFQSALFNEGGKLINIDCNLSLSNLKPSEVVSQAISKGADTLLLAPYVGGIRKALDIAKAVAQSNKNNNRKLTLLGSLTLYTGETLSVGQADVNGLVLATPWSPDATPGNRFLINAVKLWGGRVSWRTAMAYDATKAIIEGLKQSKTRDELQRVLHSGSFSVDGAAENFQFLPNGNRNGTAKLLKVQPNPKSLIGYEFVTFQP